MVVACLPDYNYIKFEGKPCFKKVMLLQEVVHPKNLKITSSYGKKYACQTLFLKTTFSLLKYLS